MARDNKRFASTKLTLELTEWIQVKRKQGFKMDVILDSLSLVEEEERSIYDLKGEIKDEN